MMQAKTKSNSHSLPLKQPTSDCCSTTEDGAALQCVAVEDGNVAIVVDGEALLAWQTN